MESGHTAAIFPPTRWSLVAAAGSDSAGARRALGELCRLYWLPLYAFARRAGFSPQDAEDATQAFLTAVTERNLFTGRDPERGRMRSFLLTAFRHDLQDTLRTSRRQKRGGAAIIVSIDSPAAERRLAAVPATGDSPERFYERQWALAVLAAAIVRMEQEYTRAGKSAQFATLRPWLNPEDRPGKGADLAAALDLSPASARQAIHRFRERFARDLREEIADTLQDPSPADIDVELASLRRALSQ